MALRIQVFENNKVIKTLKSVKSLETYMRKQQLQNGMPKKKQKTSDNSFNYSFQDINGDIHYLLVVFTV